MRREGSGVLDDHRQHCLPCCRGVTTGCCHCNAMVRSRSLTFSRPQLNVSLSLPLLLGRGGRLRQCTAAMALRAAVTGTFAGMLPRREEREDGRDKHHGCFCCCLGSIIAPHSSSPEFKSKVSCSKVGVVQGSYRKGKARKRTRWLIER